MKKIAWILVAAMLWMALCCAGAMADNTPAVTLTVNGKTGTVSTPVQKINTLIIQAPGATGVRLFAPNRWDPEKDPDRTDCWDYFDWTNPLDCLEVSWNYNWGANGRMVYAEARYDEAAKDANLREETWEEGENPWTARSNQVTLSLTYTGERPSRPSVQLKSGGQVLGANPTLTAGSWLTAEITNPQAIEGIWYWADLERQRGNDPEDTEFVEHFDFNSVNEASFSTAGYENGTYWLSVFAAAPGFQENSFSQSISFTITGAGELSDALELSKTAVKPNEEIILYACSQDSRMRLEVTRDGNPTWMKRKDWERGLVRSDWWSFDEEGTYRFTLRKVDNQGNPTGIIGSETVMVSGGNGRLSKPDLSGLPGSIPAGEGFSGTFAVDSRAKWIDFQVNYVPDQGEWQEIYRAHRTRDGAAWTDADLTMTLPASVLSRPGNYRINLNTEAPLLVHGDTQANFIVAPAGAAGSLNLLVNGSSNDISSWPSSTGLSIVAEGTGATAIRLFRGWWDVRDTPNGSAQWNEGFGDGDYTLVAQMTTADPVWRADDFNWGEFDWNKLSWTTVSNPVKVHVTSQGDLVPPTLTTVPAMSDSGTVTVPQGDFLTVTAEPQEHAEWIWAELKKRRETAWGYEWENLEDAHFDAAGSNRLQLKIPTFAFEPGEYYLEVGIDAEGWNGKNRILPVTITEPATPLPEAMLFLDAETIQAGEGTNIYAWAPGAVDMNLDIFWDGDPYWRDGRGSGRDAETWGWGCGSGGIYTFVLTASYENKEPVQLTKTLTVTSEGKLEQPVLEGIPELLTLDEGVSGSFQAIQGAEWYDVRLEYAPDEGEWAQLYEDHRQDPSAQGATAISIGPECFPREGRYKLSVSAQKIGVDNGYAEAWILVIPGSTGNGLTLEVEAPEGGNGPEIYLHQVLPVIARAAQNSGITGIRLMSLKESRWDHRAVDETGSCSWDWGFHQGGADTLIAQATTDAAVTAWANQHGGNMDGFGWNKVSWSITAEPLTVQVIHIGNLKPPTVLFTNGNTVARGTPLQFSLTPTESEGYPEDDYYLGYRIRKNAYSPVILEGDTALRIGDTREVSIPTDALPAGKYFVFAESRRYGWHGDEVPYEFTVTEESPSNVPVFKVDRNSIRTGETVTFSICAPGAEQVRLCYVPGENEIDWNYCQGELMILQIPLNWVREYHLRAYARYPDSDQWTQVGQEQTVSVTADQGAMAVSISTPDTVLQNETLVVLLKTDYLGIGGGAECLIETQGNVYYLEYRGETEHPDGTFTEIFTIPIHPNQFSPGEYTLKAFTYPDAVGYEIGTASKTVTVQSGNQPRPLLQVDKNDAKVFENIHVQVYAEGAKAIALWENEAFVFFEGDQCAEEIPVWMDGSMFFFALYTTQSLPADGSWRDPSWSGWTGRTNGETVRVSVPAHELEELNYTLEKDAVARGEDFVITIHNTNANLNASYGATLADAEAGFIGYPWSGPEEGTQVIRLNTAQAQPGQYRLVIAANAVDCYGKDVWIPVTVTEPNLTTLVLPAGLTTISEEAFAGVAAQKIIVPDGVKTIEARAFANCPNLVEIELPEGIVSFAENAFDQCGQVRVYGPANSDLADYAASVNNLVLVPTD